jgi:FAD/FMN-containing dehydrogenase
MVYPDYTFRAKNIEDVQKAVKFAAGNNVRLSVIASGHDYLGRNNAASGLSLDVSLLDGVRVEESYSPTTKGTERVKRGLMGGNASPKPGTQAAVTFGAALGTQPLNDAISRFKLFTLGAAHGKKYCHKKKT